VAKARVVVEGGRVVSVGEPLTEFCPVLEALTGEGKRSREGVRESMERRIELLGLCTPRRVLEMEGMGVGFGASECLATALERGVIETTVTVCEGAGTVITGRPELVQGIGMAMSALLETSPIPEVIRRLQERGAVVLDPSTARMDQVEGVRRALSLGHRRVGVTVMGPEAPLIGKLRELEAEEGATLLIIVVHTTGVGEELLPFLRRADMVHACASSVLRERLAPLARASFGRSIPVYALTELGERVLRMQEEKVRREERGVKVEVPRPPHPLR
jgi:putative methanogenesis marker protein 8